MLGPGDAPCAPGGIHAVQPSQPSLKRRPHCQRTMRKCDRESVGGQGVSGWKVLAPQRPGRYQHENGPNLVLPKCRRAFDHGAFLVDGG